MSESQQPTAPEPGPEEGPPEQPTPPATDQGDLDDAATNPEGQAYRARAERVAGRRVTTRSIDRREVTEYTQETITEDIPLEAYQGPGSTHPAPVG